MRIAVLSRNFSARGGGAERYSVAVVGQLAQRHEVHVFAQHFENAIPGVHYHRVPCPMMRPRWINQLYFAWATWRATRKNFDVVHSHENTWHGEVQTVHVLPIRHNLFAARKGMDKLLRWVKIVTSPRLLAYLWLEASRYKARPGRHVVLTSNTLLDVMLSCYPHTAPMLTVIPPGVDKVEGRPSEEAKQAARARLGLPLEVQLLLFVGNDFRKKGLPVLLRAMESLPAEVHLAVVGNSPRIDDMRQLARPVAGRVHFLGSMHDVADAYRAADCLVHPTLEDTYAMVVLEAISHGLPVVVSGARYCGISAELQHLQDAVMLSDPLDFRSVGDAIRVVLDDANLAARLSTRALEFANDKTWLDVGLAYEKFMQRK